MPALQRLITGMIIFVDTVVLFLHAIVRRVSRVGFTRIFSRAHVPDDTLILYLDMGTHREARELLLMINNILPRMCKQWKSYGFEADRDSFEEARTRVGAQRNVEVINRAVCYVLPPTHKVKLYKHMGKSLGNSLWRQSERYEEVEAIRLSDWFRENNFDFGKTICLLRMNIEGAEYDVVKDLVENRLIDRIDGYYGMWDDLSKIDNRRAKRFRAFLRTIKIRPFTFNGRDLHWPLRVRCIEYDINTSVHAGLLRKTIIDPKQLNYSS